MEVRSPANGEANVWVPIGGNVVDFPLHSLMYLYPAVAPDSDRAFPWSQWYGLNIETFRNSNRTQYLPEAG